MSDQTKVAMVTGDHPQTALAVAREIGLVQNSAPRLLTGEDLFVIADRFYADGSVQLDVIVNPLVNLIWLAGLVFVLGAAVAMWPDAREQRRLAERFAGEGALARA